MKEEKLRQELQRRRNKEFELLGTLPKEYKIITTQDDITVIKVSFESILLKLPLTNLPATFEFLITLGHNYPLTPPLVQMISKVFLVA